MKKHLNKFNRKPKYRLYKILVREYLQYLMEDDDTSCNSMISGV